MGGRRRRMGEDVAEEVEEEEREEKVVQEDTEVEDNVREERGTRGCIAEGEGGGVDDRGRGGRDG